MCEIVEINRSSFYAWQAAAETRQQRAAADAALLVTALSELPRLCSSKFPTRRHWSA